MKTLPVVRFQLYYLLLLLQGPAQRAPHHSDAAPAVPRPAAPLHPGPGLPHHPLPGEGGCWTVSLPVHMTAVTVQVDTAFSSRLVALPAAHTLSQLLTAWELSVRAACSPSASLTTQPGILSGV